MPPAIKTPSIYVLAGANGAGKSSIGGALFRQYGADYFNPDEAASQILSANPGVTWSEANSAAWHEGKRLLQRALRERLNFAFETTLGGRTITALLATAIQKKFEVYVWYVSLRDPELHIERVRSRVARGGHDIPEARIRERYNSSRTNLIRLMPGLAELRVYDNSDEADAPTDKIPQPRFLLHMIRAKVVTSCALTETPEWAKPILAAALKPTK